MRLVPKMATLPETLQRCVLQNVILAEEIGRGNYGIVLAATWEGTPVAVKNIQYLFDTVPNSVDSLEYEKLEQTFLKECERSSQLRHPNIVRFLGICFTEGSPIPQLVMERLSIDLNQLLQKHPGLPEGTKYNILHGVSLGIRYLHSHRPSPIIHRDLSSNNVLVSNAMEGKIGDLATAHFIGYNRKLSGEKCYGTPDFLPPEVLTDEIPMYTVSIDIFSFGCIMLHVLTHEWPTPKNAVARDIKTKQLIALSELERRENYMQKLVNKPGGIPNQIKNVIANCIANFPEERPKIEIVTDVLQAHSRIEVLKGKMKLRDRQIAPQVVENNSISFWNSLQVKRQQCPDLLVKCWPTSVAELEGKVYIIAEDSSEITYPYVYDVVKGKWSQMPALPHYKCSLVSVTNPGQLLAIGGYTNLVEVSGQVFVWNEDDKNWAIKYPNMPTARFSSSSISHGSKVIVAGGVTCCNPWTITKAVETLSIVKEISQFETHTWTKIENLPYAVYGAIPLIVHDNLYIAGGYDKQYHSTCKIVRAFLQRTSTSSSSFNLIWNKIPDMPYSSFSISYYQHRLIIFTGVSLGERPDQDKPIHQLHLYNPDEKSWDHIATASEGYTWGRLIHIKDNVIYVIGGTTDTIYRGGDNNLVKTCLMVTFVRKGRNILHNAF